MTRWAGLLATLALTAALVWLNVRWASHSLATSPLRDSKQSAATGSEALPTDDATAAPPAIAAASEALLRPLFSRSRRPFEPVPVEAEQAEPELEDVEPAQVIAEPPPDEPVPNWTLVGISLSGGSVKALLGIADGTPVQWRGQGDVVDGWTVASIGAKEVTLDRQGRRVLVPLYPPAANSEAQ